MVLSMTSHQQALGALLDEHSSLTGLRVKTLGAQVTVFSCAIFRFKLIRFFFTGGADFPGGYQYHRKKEIEFMKDIVTGKHVPYLFHIR